MSFFKDRFFAKNFALLFALNSIYIILAQFYNLPKLFDSYWFYSLFFRESMLFCTYFLAFWLLFVLPFRKVVKIFIAAMSVLSIILLLINLFLALNFDLTMNDYLIGIALQSDPNEAREFMHSYFSLKFALFSVLILVLSALILKFGGKITRFQKPLQIAFLPLFIALFLIHAFSIRPHYERSSEMLYNAYESVLYATSELALAREEYAKIGENFDKFTASHSKVASQYKIKNIVLIIGESAQREKHQIYGFYLPNTPRLMELEKSGNLLAFSDVISSRGATYESLSQILTFSNQDNFKTPWYQHLNLIDAMRLGGYKSVNISNQEQFSRWSRATTAIFGRADERHWLSLNSYFESSKPDEKVLGVLDDVLKRQENGTSLFLSIHLMGQHGVYYNRYPAGFARFSAKDVRQKTGTKTIAEYANAVLYTDFVLGEIISRFANSDSIVIYTSDHGEDVYDSAPTHILHSDSKINRFIVEVPFLVYMSDEFRLKHPQIHARIKAAQQKPFMLDDLMHSIIDISGFTIDGFEANRSLFNAEFNANRKRLVGKDASKNYDMELKSQKRAELE